MTSKALVTAAVATLITTAACSASGSPSGAITAAGGTTTVVGIVVDVDGDLTGIDSFTIRLANGTDLTLVPTSGVLFDGVAPLSHLRDHLVSGSSVEVTFIAGSDGDLVATAIGDGSGEEEDADGG